MDAFDSTQDDMTFDLAPGSPRLEAGSPQPLGANWTGRGTNFAVLSANASRVELCLFDATGRDEVARLDLPSRTGDLWHGFLPARFGGPGLQYGYRVHGPYEPARGHRFNPAKLLVDPCAQALRGRIPMASSAAGVGARARRPAVDRGQRPVCAAGRGGGRQLRLGESSLAERAVARHDHLRSARQGLHAAPSRGAAAPAWQVPRARAAGGHRAFQATGRHDDRTDAGAGLRQRAVPGRARARQLLGLQLARVVRARPALRRRRCRRSNSRRWCARCTRPGSKSSSTWCSTTLRKATNMGRRSACADSTTRSTTACRATIARITSIFPDAATRSISMNPACVRWSSTACATGPPRCASTASASTWPRSSAATPRASAGPRRSSRHCAPTRNSRT